MPTESAVAERRRQTHNNIYRHIYDSTDFCSKQSLARNLELSLPTVYQHVTELMDDGLIAFSGEQRTTGGRKAAGLSVIADARFAVGISMTKARVRFVAADLRLHEMANHSVSREFIPQASDYVGFVAQELEQFLNEFGLDRERLLGVGIAIPGVISPDNKQLVLSPTLGLKNLMLDNLSAAIPYPIHVENDASCGGYAEWFVRNSQQNMAYLSLEDGVGGAVLVNGQIYFGDNRRSAEFGHMCVEPGGLVCKCGKQGCLEAYCSARRISDDLGITLDNFFSGVEQHNAIYENLWYDLLRHLATGINSIRMALDCEVVLGGFLTEYLEPYAPLLKQYVAGNNIFEQNADYLQLSVLRKHAIPLGAAHYFIQNFLNTI